MRLVSLNAWGGNVFEPLIAYLRQVDADLLCLQEVTSAVDPSPDTLFFKGHGWDLVQHADLFGSVRETLPRHKPFFCPAMEGDLFDEAGGAYRSRFGLATFARHDLAIGSEVEVFVHGLYRADGWGEPPVPRNLHALRLVDPKSQRGFVVAHLHGLRDVEGKHDTPAREAQARRVLDALGRIRKEGDPVILCGDLNLLPDSRSFDIWGEAGLTDLVTTRGFTDTRTSLYPKSQRYADYMLVTKGIRVEAFDVVASPEVSDHRPLFLEFAVEPA